MPGLVLLAAVVVPLVAYGATAPWGEPLAASIALVAAAVTALWAWRRRPELAPRVPLAGALLLAAFVAASQALPLPGALARALSPAAHEAWTIAPFDGRAAHPLSLAPHASAGRAALFLSAALLHLACAWWMGARRRQPLAGAALGASVALLCLLAVVERLGGPAPWLAGFAQPEQAWGPFANRNDLAILAAAGTPLAAAALLAPLAKLQRRARASTEGWSAALRSGPETPLAVAWAGALAITAMAALVGGSHSGVVSLLAGLAAFTAAAWRGRARAVVPAALGVAVCAIGVSLFAGNVPGLAPIGGDLAVRADLWARVAAVVRAHPVTGCGAGALEAALPLHPEPPSPGHAFRAENDLLETAAELGLPALLALLVLGGVWLRRALAASGEPGEPGIAAAASIGSLAALAAGSMGSFVVSVPGLLLFASAAGALGVPSPSSLDEARIAADTGRRRRLALVLAAGLLALPICASRATAAWLTRGEASPERLARAATWDPRAPRVALALARQHHEAALESPEPWRDEREHIDEAMRWYARRLRSRPTDAWARLGLAALLEQVARDPELHPERARAHRREAEALAAAAQAVDPGDPAVARYRFR